MSDFNRVHFSSKTDLHATPQRFFDELNAEFGFRLDAAANEDNAKCANYFTREENALLHPWAAYENIFLNPPYGREIGAWITKARDESLKGATVVCLLPARTDTKIFHSVIWTPLRTSPAPAWKSGSSLGA